MLEHRRREEGERQREAEKRGRSKHGMQSNYRENGMGCDAIERTAVRMISKSKVLKVQYREPEGRLKDEELRGMWNGFGFDSKDGREIHRP